MHRPPKFITDVLYPLAERIIDLVFIASLPVGAAAMLGMGMLIWQRQWLWAALALGVVLCAGIGIYARFIAPKQLQTRRLRVGNAIATMPTYTVVYFSDLHVGRFKRADWTRRVVAAINAHNPDLILYGGDFYGHPPAHLRLADLLNPLRDLHARFGVYAVLGNHDYGLHDRISRQAELMALLPSLGIRVLHNEAVQVASGLNLVGLGELWVQDDNVAQAFAQLDAINMTVSAPISLPNCSLVLGHNPDLMQKITRKADLFLFGHTHAGQIYLPFAPGLGVPIQSNLYRGLHILPQGQVYVTSGCGEASTPTRLNTWPEIIILDVCI